MPFPPHSFTSSKTNNRVTPGSFITRPGWLAVLQYKARLVSSPSVGCSHPPQVHRKYFPQSSLSPSCGAGGLLVHVVVDVPQALLKHGSGGGASAVGPLATPGGSIIQGPRHLSWGSCGAVCVLLIIVLTHTHTHRGRTTHELRGGGDVTC